MAKDNSKNADDWLPAAQGVGPPDPAVPGVRALDAEGSNTKEAPPEKSVVECTPRTAENWDLGGNN